MNMQSMLPSIFGREDQSDNPFKSLHQQIERVFDEFSRGPRFPDSSDGLTAFGGLRSPRLDVSETEKTIEIDAELPGVEQQDIDVTLSEDMLTIKGEKTFEKEDKEKDYHLVERAYGSFQRTIRLPFAAGDDAVDAIFKNGVLKIVITKSPEVEAKTRKIAIGSPVQ